MMAFLAFSSALRHSCKASSTSLDSVERSLSSFFFWLISPVFCGEGSQTRKSPFRFMESFVFLFFFFSFGACVSQGPPGSAAG